MAGKNGFVGAMDNLSLLVKVILCLPLLDIVWAVYRIVKGMTTNNLGMLVFGILWIIPGSVICWLVDIISTLIYGAPKFFA